MQLLSILLHFPYGFTRHHWQCLHSRFPWTCSHWRRCRGAREILLCQPWCTRSSQGTGCLPVTNALYEIRTFNFIRFGSFTFQLWPFIWISVHLNLKSRSRLQLKGTNFFKIFWKGHLESFKRFWFCFNGKFARINLLLWFLFRWSSKELSLPSPPKSSLLDKPISESYWYWWKLDTNDTHVERSYSEISLHWHSPVLADIIGLIILSMPLYFAIQRGWVLWVEPSLA